MTNRDNIPDLRTSSICISQGLAEKPNLSQPRPAELELAIQSASQGTHIQAGEALGQKTSLFNLPSVYLRFKSPELQNTSPCVCAELQAFSFKAPLPATPPRVVVKRAGISSLGPQEEKPAQWELKGNNLSMVSASHGRARARTQISGCLSSNLSALWTFGFPPRSILLF